MIEKDRFLAVFFIFGFKIHAIWISGDLTVCNTFETNLFQFNQTCA